MKNIIKSSEKERRKKNYKLNHIYIIAGNTEGILEWELKTTVSCEVKEINPSEIKDNAYFDIIVKIR